jgi:hypothetical protein
VSLGPKNDWVGEDQQELQTTDYDRKCSVEKKIASRESQGVCRQDEMIGDKPSAVK